MSIERFKEAVRIIGARRDSGHSNVSHNPLYIASTSNGDGELHLDDMREVLAEVERLREALRRIMGLDGRDETFCFDQKCGTCDECFARAALAGSPVETRRALAERVREACAKECDRLHKMVLAGAGEYCLGQRTEQAARLIRALDLDALLGQGEP